MSTTDPRHYDVIIAPVITEKATGASEHNKVIFKVALGATKPQIDTFKLNNTLKESSGPTIAPDSDRRPAIDLAARAFSEVDLGPAPQGS